MKLEQITGISGCIVYTTTGAKRAIGNARHKIGDWVWTQDGVVFGHEPVRNFRPPVISRNEVVSGIILVEYDITTYTSCFSLYDVDVVTGNLVKKESCLFDQQLLESYLSTHYPDFKTPVVFFYDETYIYWAWVSKNKVLTIIKLKGGTIVDTITVNLGFDIYLYEDNFDNEMQSIDAYVDPVDKKVHWSVASVIFNRDTSLIHTAPYAYGVDEQIKGSGSFDNANAYVQNVIPEVEELHNLPLNASGNDWLPEVGTVLADDFYVYMASSGTKLKPSVNLKVTGFDITNCSLYLDFLVDVSYNHEATIINSDRSETVTGTISAIAGQKIKVNNEGIQVIQSIKSVSASVITNHVFDDNVVLNKTLYSEGSYIPFTSQFDFSRNYSNYRFELEHQITKIYRNNALWAVFPNARFQNVLILERSNYVYLFGQTGSYLFSITGEFIKILPVFLMVNTRIDYIGLKKGSLVKFTAPPQS